MSHFPVRRALALRLSAAAMASLVLPILAGCGGTTESVATATPDAAADVVSLLPQEVVDRGTLRVAMSVGTAPTKFIDPDDGKTMRGLDPDIAAALGKTMGLSVEIEGGSLDQVIAGLQAGRYDIAVSQMGINADRLEIFDFVEYFSSGSALATTAGGDGPQDFDSLCGRSVGVQSGSIQATEYLPAVSADCESGGEAAIDIQSFQDQPSALLALNSGRIDAVFGDKPVLEFAADKDGQVEVVADFSELKPVGIAMADGSELLPAVEAGMQRLIDDGTYAEILSEWGVTALGIEQAVSRTEE